MPAKVTRFDPISIASAAIGDIAIRSKIISNEASDLRDEGLNLPSLTDKDMAKVISKNAAKLKEEGFSLPDMTVKALEEAGKPVTDEVVAMGTIGALAALPYLVPAAGLELGALVGSPEVLGAIDVSVTAVELAELAKDAAPIMYGVERVAAMTAKELAEVWIQGAQTASVLGRDGFQALYKTATGLSKTAKWIIGVGSGVLGLGPTKEAITTTITVEVKTATAAQVITQYISEIVQGGPTVNVHATTSSEQLASTTIAAQSQVSTAAATLLQSSDVVNSVSSTSAYSNRLRPSKSRLSTSVTSPSATPLHTGTIEMPKKLRALKVLDLHPLPFLRLQLRKQERLRAQKRVRVLKLLVLRSSVFLPPLFAKLENPRTQRKPRILRV